MPGGLTAILRDAYGRVVKRPNKLRRWLARLLRKKPRVLFSGYKSAEYRKEMDGAAFCLVPRGNTPWTRRFFDAAVRGCIPAVLSDPVSFPCGARSNRSPAVSHRSASRRDGVTQCRYRYERLLDYRQLTLKLPEEWAPRTLELLRAVNRSAVASLRRGLPLLQQGLVRRRRLGARPIRVAMPQALVEGA